LKKPSGRVNNFPQKGRGLGHVTPQLFGIQSNISSKLLQLESANLVDSFLLEKPSGCVNNFPQKGRGLGHVTGKNLWQTIPNILKIILATDFHMRIPLLGNSHMECRLLLK